MRRSAKPTAEIYQIKVTLNESKPPIWRRFQVSGDVRLSQLHDVLQAVMGWYDSHLHQFLVGGTRFGLPDPDFGGIENDNRVTLRQVAPEEGVRFVYEYDFGDSWEHMLLVEKICPPDPVAVYPICLAGRRHCPPEDCGGIWGYADFLEAIKDPEHPDHDDLLAWAGGEFDPEAFDLAAINRALARLGQRRRIGR